MQKSLIEPEIFGIFQHKVERTPHFARVSEVRHIFRGFSAQNFGFMIVIQVKLHEC